MTLPETQGKRHTRRMAFLQKNINATECLGQDLRELRERAGFTLEAAAQQTKITPALLRDWERNEWNAVGDLAYTERMLRAYVQFFGANPTYFLQKFREATGEALTKERSKDAYLPKVKSVSRWDLLVGSRLVTLLFFLAFVAGLAGYVWFQARAISVPPPLVVESPLEGERLTDPQVEVRGTTLPEASLTINDREAIVQPDGSFHYTLNVPRGTTLLIVTAKKRHGRENTVTRRVVFDRASAPNPLTPTSTNP